MNSRLFKWHLDVTSWFHFWALMFTSIHRIANGCFLNVLRMSEVDAINLHFVNPFLQYIFSFFMIKMCSFSCYFVFCSAWSSRLPWRIVRAGRDEARGTRGERVAQEARGARGTRAVAVRLRGQLGRAASLAHVLPDAPPGRGVCVEGILEPGRPEAERTGLVPLWPPAGLLQKG